MKLSRDIISGELSWAFVALVEAWAGAGGWPFAPGVLHDALAAVDHDVVWPIIIVPPAIGLLVVSLREWLADVSYYDRLVGDWSLADLEWSVKLRGWFCILLVMAWLYMLYVLIPDFGPQVEGANTLIALAVGGFFFTGWFYVENRRVQREIRNQYVVTPHP